MKSNSKNKIFTICTCILVAIVCFILGEIFLRIIPIHGIGLKTSRFNRLVGTSFEPNATVVYTNDRGAFVKRKINRWGYLDINHKKKKDIGIFRIGFFGDSFTEARQVPINSTFFRLIEKNLKNKNVECLSFGISEFSTLQSYLTCKKYVDFFDLDLVVYVFFDNDIGDQISEIKQISNIPYAILKDDSLIIDNSFKDRNQYRNSMVYKFADWTMRHSVLISTIIQRVRLLIHFGVKMEVNNDDRMMELKSDNHQKYPNQNDLPSTWPEGIKKYAISLCSKVILVWKRMVENKSKEFVILYIPRPGEWKKKISCQDSWKYWLSNFCNKERIEFIDPTNSFFTFKSEKNVEFYYDHLTLPGHIAVCNAFVKWFREN